MPLTDLFGAGFPSPSQGDKKQGSLEMQAGPVGMLWDGHSFLGLPKADLQLHSPLKIGHKCLRLGRRFRHGIKNGE